MLYMGAAVQPCSASAHPGCRMPGFFLRPFQTSRLSMKFRFPIVVIDEDWRADSASGLGIRALAKAIEDQGTEVVGGFTYYDVAMVANQAARVGLHRVHR